MLGTVGTHAQGQTLYKKPLYNSTTDFTPVALLAEVPIVLTTRKDLPVNDFKEFVAYAKANQDKMKFGSAGAGSATHLGCVLLNYVIGTDITHVPYRGTGPAMQDLASAAASTSCARSSPPPSRRSTAAPSRRSRSSTRSARRRCRTCRPRSSRARQNLEAYTWNAFFLPKGTPDADREEAQRRRRAGDQDAGGARAPAPGSARRSSRTTAPRRNISRQFVKSEIEKWAAPIKASGVSID